MTLHDKTKFFVINFLIGFPTRKLVSLFESSKRWTNMNGMSYFIVQHLT